MVQALQRQDDPSLQSNGTDEKREYHRQYNKGYHSPAIGLACGDGVALKEQDPDLEWPEVVSICNNALSFEDGYVIVRGRYGEGGKVSRQSAKLHVAICQEGHKVGKTSGKKNKNDDFCCGEMWGTSTGKKNVRGSDGTSYAQVLKMDGSYLGKPDWEEAVGDNRWTVFESDNDKNVRSVYLLLRCSNWSPVFLYADFIYTTGKWNLGYLPLCS